LNAGISWDRNFQNAVLARLDRINHDGIRAWPSVVWLACVNTKYKYVGRLNSASWAVGVVVVAVVAVVAVVVFLQLLCWLAFLA